MRTIRFRNERREKIVGLLLSKRRMSVTELSKQLRVTGATIRADLEALTQENKLIRTYGGALAPQKAAAPELAMDVRMHSQVEQKQAIGRMAASLVQDGTVVKAGMQLASWDPLTRPIITEYAGTVKFENVEEGVTVAKQIDEVTGLSTQVVIDAKRRSASSAKNVRPTMTFGNESSSGMKLTPANSA